MNEIHETLVKLIEAEKGGVLRDFNFEIGYRNDNSNGGIALLEVSIVNDSETYCGCSGPVYRKGLCESCWRAEHE